MSKLLKFIVNLFLIVTILIAVAILVPPLAGVTTTIVDTPSMNTNLPLGSVTYSTDINVYDIKAGDEILKENDSSTYAYIIREADPDNGKFVAMSAADENGTTEEVILRNTVSKVAVIVPFIGYIVMAMHSIEGIVIIILVVVLMIILFILSELWKHSPEDEEEEESDPEKAGEAPNVTGTEETDIDTGAIKEAVEENNATVREEDGADAPLSGEDAAAAALGAAAGAAVAAGAEGAAETSPSDAADVTKAPTIQLTDKEAATLDDIGRSFDEARKNETDTFNYAQLEIPETAAAKSGGEEEYNPFEGFESRKADSESGAPEDAMNLDAASDGAGAAEAAAAAGAVGAAAAGGTEGRTLAELADEMDKKATEGLPVIADPEELEMAAAEMDFFGGTKETAASENPEKKDDGPDMNAERFAPVERPALDEILDAAKTSGKDPVVRKDERSGVSIVDMSDFL